MRSVPNLHAKNSPSVDAAVLPAETSACPVFFERLSRPGRFAVIGGTSGLGRSAAEALTEAGHSVVLYGRSCPESPKEADFRSFNLLSDDISSLKEELSDLDGVIITAGAGRTAFFDALRTDEVLRAFRLNAESVALVLHAVFDRLLSDKPYFCAVVSSIAGRLPSPCMAAYGAAKAALGSLAFSLNAELSHRKSPNRILAAFPGFFEGTRFNGGPDEPEKTRPMAEELLRRMAARETEWIPLYDEVYAEVLARAARDPQAFALSSIAYKEEKGRTHFPYHARVGLFVWKGAADAKNIARLEGAKRLCDRLIVLADGKDKDLFAILCACRYADEAVSSADAVPAKEISLVFSEQDSPVTQLFPAAKHICLADGVPGGI